jgi:hypothetical protein
MVQGTRWRKAGVVQSGMQTMTFTRWRRRWKAAGQAIRACASMAVIVGAGITSATLTPGICFAQAEAPKHTITVTFDYDFTATHACSPKITKKCIAKFVVYDISGDKPYKLFTIPVPADATGPVKGVSGESQPLLFESGKHKLAVTAQNDKGEESNSYAATIWVTIP